jgi:hypothetical protein
MAEPLERAQSSKQRESARGPFKINENPPIGAVLRPDQITAEIVNGYECNALTEKYGEVPVREKVGEMLRSYVRGAVATPLFGQPGPNGMSLAHVWFGANLPVFRHSHPAGGDCLYYVAAGELVMGKHRLKAGSTFFIPNGMPYKFSAGPAGVEVLEFRAGGGEPSGARMKLDEQSLDSIQRLIDSAQKNEPLWEVPERIGDTALRQAEIEGRR